MDKKYVEKIRDHLVVDGWKGSTDKLESVIHDIEKEIYTERFLFLSRLKTQVKFKNSEILDIIFEDFKNEIIEKSKLFSFYSYNENNISITFFNKKDNEYIEYIEYVFHSLNDFMSTNAPYVRKGNYDNSVVENIIIEGDKFIYVQEE